MITDLTRERWTQLQELVQGCDATGRWLVLTHDNPDMSTFIHTFLEPEHLPHPEAYLEKPVSQDRLLEVVAGLMDREESV